MEQVSSQPNWSLLRSIVRLRHWWRKDVIETVDQVSVIEKRREDCALSGRYMFMTAMSGGIAILGLLLSSPAVVIGAMLLSPLMGPIMGLGFALAIGDYRWLRQSIVSLTCGSLMAIGLCAAVVFLSPLQDITAEIAARTRPNLFDLIVALFSSMAGAYAMIRGREGTIVGVAIATALMPPLAVVGFGLATWNWTVFSGALLLYITNLVTIALTAWAMVRLYGFRTNLSDRHTQMQNLAIVAVFIALAVPLGFSLRQIAWEANAARQVRQELADNFGPASRLSQPEIKFGTDPLQVSAFVWTTKLVPAVQGTAQKKLSERLGRKVDLQLKQFLVRDETSAEQAQIASAILQDEQVANARINGLATRLSLAAGVPDSEVLIDRERHRALVRAQVLPGATLASYAALESRIKATEPEWNIELVPPPLTVGALPSVSFEEGELSEAGAQSLNLIAWAAQRTGKPVALIGPEQQTEIAAQWLAEREVSAEVAIGQEPLQAIWAEPAAENATGQ